MADDGWTVVQNKKPKAPKPKSAKPKAAAGSSSSGGSGGSGASHSSGGGGVYGGVDTSKKFSAGSNKQHKPPANAKKIEDLVESGEDSLKVKTISIEVSKAIQQKRQELGWSQKDLATKINEKANVINEYESGRATPDPAVLGKLERALGVKLRGKK